MSPERNGINLPKRGFPRVSGDEPRDGYLFDMTDVFSPRERG